MSEQGVSSVEKCALSYISFAKVRKLFDDVYIPIVHMKKNTHLGRDVSMKRTRKEKLRTVIGGGA